MQAPVPETTPPPLKPPAPEPQIASLEAVELELALGHKELGDDRFETVVRETIGTLGGVLLFLMDMSSDSESRWVAAVAFGDGATDDIAIIDLPKDGSRPRVVPATDCDLPIARIAGAYAGLAHSWANAA
jgi:hypothetical protein